MNDERDYHEEEEAAAKQREREAMARFLRRVLNLGEWSRDQPPATGSPAGR